MWVGSGELRLIRLRGQSLQGDFRKGYRFMGIIRPLRLSKRPAKALVWRWLENDLSSHEFESVLDLACGEMRLARFVRCTRYTGVDIDQDRLAAGKKHVRLARTLCGRIEDLPAEESASLVMCMQTIGENELFRHSKALEVTLGLSKHVLPGGSLVFNVGPLVENARELADGLEKALLQEFERVVRRNYGAFHGEISLPISTLIAVLMYFIRPLRTFFGRADSAAYFYCSGKTERNRHGASGTERAPSWAQEHIAGSPSNPSDRLQRS